MARYRQALKTNADDRQILESRGFLKDGHLTNAGILLFSRDPSRHLPQARLRFLRYDGDQARTGERINIIKEQTQYQNILLLGTSLIQFSCVYILLFPLAFYLELLYEAPLDILVS